MLYLGILTFLFFEKRLFHYENDDKKMKMKRSFVVKLVVSLIIVNNIPSLKIVNDDPRLTKREGVRKPP